MRSGSASKPSCPWGSPSSSSSRRRSRRDGRPSWPAWLKRCWRFKALAEFSAFEARDDGALAVLWVIARRFAALLPTDNEKAVLEAVGPGGEAALFRTQLLTAS